MFTLFFSFYFHFGCCCFRDAGNKHEPVQGPFIEFFNPKMRRELEKKDEDIKRTTGLKGSAPGGDEWTYLTGVSRVPVSYHIQNITWTHQFYCCGCCSGVQTKKCFNCISWTIWSPIPVYNYYCMSFFFFFHFHSQKKYVATHDCWSDWNDEYLRCKCIRWSFDVCPLNRSTNCCQQITIIKWQKHIEWTKCIRGRRRRKKKTI